MLILGGQRTGRFCDGISRRGFLKVGALSVGGLTLADLLRLKAHGAAPNAGTPGRAVIMVYLNGGPSHIDLYDPKPDAPVEYRGEFKPIRTNVPGMDISELMPLQAKIADKLAIIRNMKFLQQGHTAPELYTGFLTGNRPAIGSVVSKLRSDASIRGALPPNVYLGDANHVGKPGFLGKAHEAYIPGAKAMNLGLGKDMTLDRLNDRRQLMRSFDTLRRDLDDARGSLAGMDSFTAQALEMIATDKARDAFDVTKEPESVRTKYGPGTEFLQARRLVEAGVPFVTLTPRTRKPGPMCNGEWDHHDHIFRCLRAAVPQLDQSIHALVTDLHDRGLLKSVAVCVWGEMGRTPRVGTQRGTTGGRDHWPQSGFALLAGGGLQTGQVIGATDARGENPRGRPYTPQNVLATLYDVLGIDPTTTLPDHQGRPVYLLDDRDKAAELH
jgi:uncharacterized protein (DUF1501 family)